MNGAARPRYAHVGNQALTVQHRRNDTFRHSALQKELVDAVHYRNFFLGTWHEDDAVGLYAFPLAP